MRGPSGTPDKKWWPSLKDWTQILRSLVTARSVSTRRWSTTPRSRSRSAWGVAPKFGLSRSLRTSVLSGLVLSLSRGLRSRSPLPTPGGHAGVRSTSSTLPQAVSNTVPMSRATPTTVHRNREKMKRCFTPPYYDVNSHLPRHRLKSPCYGAREQDADKLRCGRRSATVSASYRYSAFRVESLVHPLARQR